MRIVVVCLVLALACPAPVVALRPTSAGQEESATAQLTHALAAGSEEKLQQRLDKIAGMDRRRFLLMAAGVAAFHGLPDSSSDSASRFAAEERFLQEPGTCIPQDQVAAALNARFAHAPSDRARAIAETIWAEVQALDPPVPLYLVEELDRWHAFLERFEHPVVNGYTSYSLTTGRQFVAAYAPMFDVGLFLHEVGVHVAGHRQLASPLVNQPAKIRRWMAANRDNLERWRAFDREVRDFARHQQLAPDHPLLPRLEQSADVAFLSHTLQAALKGMPAADRVLDYDPLRTTVVDETLAWTYQYLVAPWPEGNWLRRWNGDLPTAAEQACFQGGAERRQPGYRRAIQRLAANWRQLAPDDPLRQQLTRVYTKILQLPDPWPPASPPAADAPKGGLEEPDRSAIYA